MLYKRRMLPLIGALVAIATILWAAAPSLELFNFRDETRAAPGENEATGPPELAIEAGVGHSKAVSAPQHLEPSSVASLATGGPERGGRVAEHAQYEARRFAVHKLLSLPEPAATRPLEILLQSEWVGRLQSFLETVSAGPVTLVSSDYGYREVLLNWLISATVRVARPLSNILVLSLDASLYHLLVNRSISCIHVSPEYLLDPSVKLSRHVAFTQVHVMRLTVMRLINHWGFDVANYDTDALILRNPEHLYYAGSLKDRNFIGSVGHFPKAVLEEWGVAVCIGVVFIRSTPQTEMYWEMMNKVLPLSDFNDQARLNAGLQLMEVQPEGHPSSVMIATKEWLGRGRDGFTVAVLPISVVCRQSCSKKLEQWYYVWHKGGSKNRDGKMKYASKGGLWFLRSDWEAVTHKTTATGWQWLKELTDASDC